MAVKILDGLATLVCRLQAGFEETSYVHLGHFHWWYTLQRQSHLETLFPEHLWQLMVHVVGQDTHRSPCLALRWQDVNCLKVIRLLAAQLWEPCPPARVHDVGAHSFLLMSFSVAGAFGRRVRKSWVTSKGNKWHLSSSTNSRNAWTNSASQSLQMLGRAG